MEALTRKVKTLLLEHVELVGSFGIAAGGAVDAAVLRGKGFAVVKAAGVGIYTITFQPRYKAPKLECFTAVLSTATGTVDVEVKPISGADPTEGVYTVQTVKRSDGTAVDSAAACEVHFRIAVANTSLPDAT